MRSYKIKISKKTVLATLLIVALSAGTIYYLAKSGFFNKTADTSKTNEVIAEEQEANVKQLTAASLDLNYSYENDQSGDNSNKLKGKLTERQKALETLAKDNPETFLGMNIPDGIKNDIPAKFKDLVETDIENTGEITVNYLKYHDLETIVKTYTTTINSIDYGVYFVGDDPDYIGGSKLKIKGKKIGAVIATYPDELHKDYSTDVISVGKLAFSSTKIITGDYSIDTPLNFQANALLAAKPSDPIVAPPTPTTAPANPKEAVILLNFSDTATGSLIQKPLSAEAVSQVNAFWSENSLGKTVISSDIYGPYTMPYTTASCGETTNKSLISTTATRDNIASFAETSATKDGFTASNYVWFHYVFPHSSSAGCGSWDMSTSSPFTKTWWNRQIDTFTLAWQNGRALGLQSARGWRCKDSLGNPVAMGYQCSDKSSSLSTYLDPADIMGETGKLFHSNIRYKAGVSWVPVSKVQTVTADGRYTVTPIETANSGLQGIRIYKEKVSDQLQRYYYLETRKSYGFDNFAATDPFVGGVSVRVGSEYGQWGGTQLIDNAPSTETFADAPLMPGQSFKDPYIGLTVTVVSISSEGAVIDVKFGQPECIPGVPNIVVGGTWPSVNNSVLGAYVAPGSISHYRGYISNNDSAGCPKRTMVLSTPNLPTGWTSAFSSNDIELSPGAPYQIVDIMITPPVDAANGTYDIPVNVSEKDNAVYNRTLKITSTVGSPADVYNLSLATNASSYSPGGAVTVTATLKQNGQVLTGVCATCRNGAGGIYYVINMVMVKADGTTLPLPTGDVDVYLNRSGLFQYKFNTASTDPKGTYKIMANLDSLNRTTTAIATFTVN